MENLESIKDLRKIVLDTSSVVENSVKMIIKELDYPEIIIPEAVIAELEYQANKGRFTGINGLKHVENLQKLEENGEISVTFTGRRPNKYEISLSKTGEIDAMIRDVAKSELATLITSDKIQSLVAKAQGINVIYIPQDQKDHLKLKIHDFFDDDTTSVHLKENVVPMVKKGKPGNISLVKLSNEKLTYGYLQELVNEIVENSRHDFKSYVEMDMEGATVVQSREFRISIAKPPFSEGLEITVVRPVANVSIYEYELSDMLIEKLKNSANGILISGSPGAGKSTFAQALAEFYSGEMNKIVKTMESPRDLQVGDEITQYSPLEGSMEKTSDLLLLVRPDFTIYDELRKTDDFHIFADMRLAGVGMVGVVHATKPIDGIQRIASRVELGIIPSIVDTNIFIEDGEIKDVYETNLTVKVPSGMKEADLARPVIEVHDFKTKELKNEIYTYGEQTIVMDIDLLSSPVGSKKKSSLENIAEKEILKEVKKILPKSRVRVDFVSENRVDVYIEERYIPRFIGKGGKRIDKLETKLGINIGVESIDDVDTNVVASNQKTTNLDVDKSKKFLNLYFPKESVGNSFEIYAGDVYLFTATVGKNSTVRIRTNLELSDTILDALELDVPIVAKEI
ncbi:MAG: PINc/VapC family ATPase [Methanobrevibacter sp.]|jgi:ATPase|nr:PINc/VapC family ATPase [Candidatus Methanovirga aequatorialis]